MILKTFTLFTLFLIASCATHQEPVQKSNLTFATVKKGLVKGQTTQSEVLSLLGSPNIMTKNKLGEEIWSYSKESFSGQSSSVGWFALLAGGQQNSGSSSSSTMDLIIVYDSNDVVKDYTVVSSKF